MRQSDTNMNSSEINMVQIGIQIGSLDERIKKIEDKKLNLSTMISLATLVITIILNIGNFSNMMVNKQYKKFVRNYSEAYTKVVNSYVNGKGDFSPLDDYIANTKDGRDLKKIMINNINNNIKDGIYKRNVNYTFTFNYSHYVSMKENGQRDLMYVSGVTYGSSDGSLEGPDSAARVYGIIRDKNNIKIETKDEINTKNKADI